MSILRNPKRYGWHPSLPDKRDLKLIHSAEKVAARPKSADLTMHMPPVYDQGQVGSCTANASGAAFEYDAMVQGIPFWTPSRLFIYWNARNLEGTTSQDAGAQIRDVVAGLVKWGTPEETEWPYDQTKWMDEPPAQCYTDAAKNRVLRYLAVNQTVDDICTTVAGGKPVIFGFSVYSYFESEQMAQTGILKMPTTSDSLLGGHATLVVGYDDDDQQMIVRNSWGPNWGQKGYFRMPYPYIEDPNLADDFWVLETVA
jgi:C1A family cysteine protease